MRSIRFARRAALGAALTAGLLGSAATPAYADQVALDFSSLIFTDDLGEATTLTVEATPDSITFTNAVAGDTIDGPNACDGDNTLVLTCTPADVGEERIRWGADMVDLGDTVVANGSQGGDITGGEGDDNLTGSDTNGTGESLYGEEGNDGINSRNVGPALPGSGPFLAYGDGGGSGNPGDFLSGGPGNDNLLSGNGDDVLDGDFFFTCCFPPDVPQGVDVLSSGAGNDRANGGGSDGDRVDLGDGNDQGVAEGGDGNGDVLDGGPGFDTLQQLNDTFPENEGDPFVPDNFAVDLLAGTATRGNNGGGSDQTLNFEDAFTSLGDDSVTGTEGSNVIGTPGEAGGFLDSLAGGGDGGGFTVTPDVDVVNPLGGADTVAVGFGNDTVDSRDGFQDRVLCGQGADTALVDQFDLLTDCEAVTIEQRRAAGADIAAPDCTISRVKRTLGRSAFFRGFSVSVACNEPGTLLIQVIATMKKGLFSRTGDVVLAEKTVQLAGANTTTRVKPRLKKRLRNKRFRARVLVEARDQYGNRSIERKNVRVKKAKPKRRRRR